MAKFRTGFLLGALAGTAYVLLTTKKSGPARLHALSTYVRELTGATGDVQHAVSRFTEALAALREQVDTNLKPNVKDITDRVDQFEFQTQARMQNVDDHLAGLNRAADDLTGEATHPTDI